MASGKYVIHHVKRCRTDHRGLVVPIRPRINIAVQKLERKLRSARIEYVIQYVDDLAIITFGKYTPGS